MVYERYLTEGNFISTKNSRKKVTDNIEMIKKGMRMNVLMCKQATDDTCITVDKFLKGKLTLKEAELYQKRMHDYDYNRGEDKELIDISKSYIKRKIQKNLFNRKDYKTDEIIGKEKELTDYCNNKVLPVLLDCKDRMYKRYDKLKNMKPDYNNKLHYIIFTEFEWIMAQIYATLGDTKSLDGIKDWTKDDK